MKRLLLRESQVQPLLLVFEDLHWIDAETQALLDSLVESLPTARLLLLVNYRPEYQHGWGSKTYYTPAAARPAAAPRAPTSCSTRCSATTRASTPLKQLLDRADRGQPVLPRGERADPGGDEGAGRGTRGRIGWRRPSTTIQVPATVQAMLAARIDRLPPEDKRLLQAAAVIGKDVPFALLQAIAELPEEALRRGLDHLQAAEFLYETSLFPDLEYTFKHALTHEVTYGGLLQERRRELHARIVGRDRDAPPGSPRRADRAARPSRPPGRAAGEGGALSPAGRTQGGRAVGAPGRPGLVRAGAGRPRGAAGEPVHAGAGLRDPPRAAAGAGPAR